jgi:hypothetical protein
MAGSGSAPASSRKLGGALVFAGKLKLGQRKMSFVPGFKLRGGFDGCQTRA